MTTYDGVAISGTPGVTASSAFSSTTALYATSSAGGNAIYATSTGVPIYATTSTTVSGYAAIYGENTGDISSGSAVAGLSYTEEGAGVLGWSDEASVNGYGVYGYSENNIGVYGTGGSYGIYSEGDAVIDGDLDVTGTITKMTDNFRIDHPLSPTERYLNHSVMESSEMKNLYDGVVTGDASGRAIVQLPNWFEALNEDFRYQLTALGTSAPNLHVAKEVQGGRFEIAGAHAGQRICWQVTGVRKDAYAKAHPLVVEEQKSQEKRGTYTHPELYGLPKVERKRGRLPRPTSPTPKKP